MVPQSSPFPGMNPFLEQHWSDVHTRLITYICDALATDLPMDLIIRAEERASVSSDEPARPERSTAVPLAEPEVVLVEPMTERWIEIREGARLVTVIEVLSPSNKRDEGRAAYRLKQRDYLTALVNLVEIDLLRGGQPTVAVDVSRLRPTSGTAYTVCVSRAAVAGPAGVLPRTPRTQPKLRTRSLSGPNASRVHRCRSSHQTPPAQRRRGTRPGARARGRADSAGVAVIRGHTCRWHSP